MTKEGDNVGKKYPDQNIDLLPPKLPIMSDYHSQGENILLLKKRKEEKKIVNIVTIVNVVRCQVLLRGLTFGHFVHTFAFACEHAG